MLGDGWAFLIITINHHAKAEKFVLNKHVHVAC